MLEKIIRGLTVLALSGTLSCGIDRLPHSEEDGGIVSYDAATQKLMEGTRKI